MNNKEQIIIFEFEANKANTNKTKAKSKRRKSNKRKNKSISLQASADNQEHPVQSNTSDTYEQKYKEACLLNAELRKEQDRLLKVIDNYQKSFERKQILINKLNYQCNSYVSILATIKSKIENFDKAFVKFN